MGDPKHLSEQLSSLAELIDELCDEYERCWQRNTPPRLEDFLLRVEPGQRLELFRELVGIEFHWRKLQRQDVFDVNEYRQRFPEYREVLEHEIGTHHGERVETLYGVRRNAHEKHGPPSTGFGGYDLLSEIGRGGMGVVYRAVQRSANRTVALKMIRREKLEAMPEAKRQAIRERFYNECQATARLQHDHLVTVYEVGDFDGQPFFSMQLVEGCSLADILRRGPLPNITAARYLESIARAVHHAHSHGILHRDLKPQNVMIDQNSDRALVVDFGLAKVLEQSESMTRTGEILGTPSYMSPEQVTNASQVSARTDVYALGATLYDMLTARPPFEAATPLETLRQVVNEDAVAPRKLNPAIDRDLETICLKCLHKEPIQRYATALALAEDLQRYHQHRPILAKRTGITGHVQRWIRRSPLAASLAAIACVSILLTLLVLVVSYQKQRHSLQMTREAYVRSDESFHDAVETVKRLCTRVSEDTLLNQPGMQPVRRELLLESLRYFEKFLRQRKDDPLLRSDLAVAHFQIGLLTEELESPDKALPSYEQARTVQQQLQREVPADRSRRVALAATSNRIGRANHRMQRFQPALEAYQEALRTREILAEDEPTNTEFQRGVANTNMNLGLVYADLNQFADAQLHFTKAQSIRQNLLATNREDESVQRDLAQGFFNFAHLEIRRSAEQQAKEYLLKAAMLFQQLTQREPAAQDDLYRLGLCYRMLADRGAALEDAQQTGDYYRRAQRIADQLVSRNPAVVSYRMLLAGVQLNWGQWLQEQRKSQEALSSVTSSIAILDPLVNHHPEMPEIRRDLAAALRLRGILEAATGSIDAARASLLRALRELERLVTDFPENTDFATERDEVQVALMALDNSAPNG